MAKHEPPVDTEKDELIFALREELAAALQGTVGLREQLAEARAVLSLFNFNRVPVKGEGTTNVEVSNRNVRALREFLSK